MTEESDSKFKILLDHLQRSRGLDLHGYKRTTLTRRILKRMQTVGVTEYLDYIDYLEVHPEEFTQLFNTILINVTSFFRDGAPWEYLEKEVMPYLLANKAGDGTLRVWSAGCASGEEVYSLAMLLAEAVGINAFTQRVKIYATDVDEEALNTARQGIYSDKDMQPVEAGLIDKYFKQSGTKYTFRADLRRSIVFGRHDLVEDAPISRLNLLVCRNTLMYFNAEAQNKILARFHFALDNTGFLFLGKAEMLLTHPNLFTPVSMPARIFSKIAQPALRERMLILGPSGSNEAETAAGLENPLRLNGLAFETGGCAQVIVDAAGRLALANARARELFNLSAVDLGKPIKDLELSYRPVELHSVFEKVYSDYQPVRFTNVEINAKDSDAQYLDIEVKALMENEAHILGLSVQFEDVTSRQKLQTDLQRCNHELAALNEEIESTHEELETTNEELQSTNEELETTNEELQATNEELETTNEELHSTNEELEALNTELGQRTDDANQSNAFLQSILASLRSGVIVVDKQFNLLLWNQRAEDLWGLRTEEVQGKSLYSLDIGLPLDKIPLRPFLSGTAKHEEASVAATNRRGKTIQCHIVLTPFWSVKGEREGVVLLIEES